MANNTEIAKESNGIFPYSQNSHSPYRQQNKLVLAPDAIVTVYGSDSIVTCPDCCDSRNFQQDISSIDVSLSIDAVPGSASFSVAAPRHDPDRYSKNGRLAFQPLMEVAIYIKGRFLEEKSREPQYIHVFWGIITDVSLIYSGGTHTINVSCADILRLWEIQTINVRGSALTIQYSNRSDAGGHTSIFHGMNPFEIIHALGNMTSDYSMTPPTANSAVVGLNGSAGMNMMTSGVSSSGIPVGGGAIQDHNRMQYWDMRSNQIGKALKIFGMDPSKAMTIADKNIAEAHLNETGLAAIPSSLPAPMRFAQRQGLTNTLALAARVSGKGFGLGGLAASALALSFGLLSNDPGQFHPYDQIGSYELFQDDIQNKLTIAQNIKTLLGYEFYMDTTGEIIFKPPFYNMNTRDHSQVYEIKDLDIISFTTKEDEREIVATRVDVLGSYGNYLHEYAGEGSAPSGVAINFPLIHKFGYRYETTTALYLATPQACANYAMSKMDILNARYYSASVVIAGRPELRMGVPVYIESLDSYFYIQGISHSFSFGSSFTTSLNLIAGRKRGNIKVDGVKPEIVKSTSTDFFGKTSNTQIVYTPNVVCEKNEVFNRDELWQTVTGENLKNELINSLLKDNPASANCSGGSNEIKSKKGKGQVWADMIPEVKTHLAHALMSSFMQPQGEQKYVKSDVFEGKSAYEYVNLIQSGKMKITDEDGYYVVGMLPYGSGMKMDSSGNIVKKKTSAEELKERQATALAEATPWTTSITKTRTTETLDGFLGSAPKTIGIAGQTALAVGAAVLSGGASLTITAGLALADLFTKTKPNNTTNGCRCADEADTGN